MAEPTKDGRTREVLFTLDKEKIHQIFSIRPAVRAAYLVHVPSRMTDTEFWTKYCRAMIVKKARRGKAPATEQEAADLRMFAEDDERTAKEQLQQARARGRGRDSLSRAARGKIGAHRGKSSPVVPRRCDSVRLCFVRVSAGEGRGPNPGHHVRRLRRAEPWVWHRARRPQRGPERASLSKTPAWE